MRGSLILGRISRSFPDDPYTTCAEAQLGAALMARERFMGAVIVILAGLEFLDLAQSLH